jgi:hypothetical protein
MILKYTGEERFWNRWAFSWQRRWAQSRSLLAIQGLRRELESWMPRSALPLKQKRRFARRIASLEAEILGRGGPASARGLGEELTILREQETAREDEIAMLNRNMDGLLTAAAQSGSAAYRERVMEKWQQFETARRSLPSLADEARLQAKLADCHRYHREMEHLCALPRASEYHSAACRELRRRIDEAAASPSFMSQDEDLGIRATLARAEQDAERGDYERAIASFRDLHSRQQSFLHRIATQANYVREEIEWWRRHPVYGALLSSLPIGDDNLSSGDLERWYAIRAEIRQLVDQRASAVRAANAPANGRNRKQLSVSLEETRSDAILRAFAKAAWSRRP